MKPYENQMPAGVDSFVEEASKEEVKAPEKPMQQKFTSKDYGNVRVYPNETGSNMDKNNKWIGKRYSLMEAHKLDDNYLKNNLVGKTKSGADIYKMPDGYFSGNPRINDASFKNVQDLEDFEKKSGEHRAAMKEGTYLDDYIKNYKQPKQSPEQKVMDDKTYDKVRAAKKAGDTTIRTDKEWSKIVNNQPKQSPEQKPNIVTYGNSSKFLEKYGLDKYFEFDGMDLVDKRDYSTTAINFGREGKSEEELLNEIKKYYPTLFNKEQSGLQKTKMASGTLYENSKGDRQLVSDLSNALYEEYDLNDEIVDSKIREVLDEEQMKNPKLVQDVIRNEFGVHSVFDAKEIADRWTALNAISKKPSSQNEEDIEKEIDFFLNKEWENDPELDEEDVMGFETYSLKDWIEYLYDSYVVEKGIDEKQFDKIIDDILIKKGLDPKKLTGFESPDELKTIK